MNAMNRFIFLLAFAGACGGCQGDRSPLEPMPRDSSIQAADVVGVYQLATINGYPGPWVVAIGPTESVHWIRGSLTLRADGTFADSLYGEIRTLFPETVTPDSSARVGTFSVVGDSVLFVAGVERYSMAPVDGQLERFIGRQQYSATLVDLTLRYSRAAPRPPKPLF